MQVLDLSMPRKRGAGALLYAYKSKRFLLIKRSNFVSAPLTWALPGGSINDGEAVADGCAREVLEETGIVINPQDLYLIHTEEEHAPRFIYYSFATAVDREIEPKLNWESESYIWCGVDELPSPLHPGVQALFSSNSAAQRMHQLSQKQK
jgi:ADP-ribose pyrophosphatase YjhB (NUDIX family)